MPCSELQDQPQREELDGTNSTGQIKTTSKKGIALYGAQGRGSPAPSAQLSALCSSIMPGESEHETVLERKILVLELRRAIFVLHGDSQGSPMKVP